MTHRVEIGTSSLFAFQTLQCHKVGNLRTPGSERWKPFFKTCLHGVQLRQTTPPDSPALPPMFALFKLDQSSFRLICFL